MQRKYVSSFYVQGSFPMEDIMRACIFLPSVFSCSLKSLVLPCMHSAFSSSGVSCSNLFCYCLFSKTPDLQSVRRCMMLICMSILIICLFRAFDDVMTTTK